MTPFDPTALLAMLRAFYPVASAAAFASARLERPEYFAGGAIVSTGRDKIQLPDGRIFDMIFNVDGIGGAPAWQALDINLLSDDPSEPLRLTYGPLAPIDVSTWRRPAAAPVFLPIVTAALGDLGDVGGALDRAHEDLAAHSSPAAFTDDMDASLEIGNSARVDEYQLAGLSIPDDVFAAMDGAHAELDAHETELPTTFPDPFGDTWISEPPRDDGGPPPGSDIDLPPIWNL